MDTKTGRIYDLEKPKDKKAIDDLNGKFPGRVKPMNVVPTEKQMYRRPPKVGRNDPCPCGSGKKFKVCCLTKGDSK